MISAEHSGFHPGTQPGTSSLHRERVGVPLHEIGVSALAKNILQRRKLRFISSPFSSHRLIVR
jgi:hypothetical protein